MVSIAALYTINRLNLPYFIDPTEKQRQSLYESDWTMIHNFVRELNEYQMRIVATGNKPNDLYDGVKWSALMDVGEQLETLKTR